MLCLTLLRADDANSKSINGPLRQYLYMIQRDVNIDGYWSSGNGGDTDIIYPPGGVIEKIHLPTAIGEEILLLRCSLDEFAVAAQTDPPLPETFRAWVQKPDGSYVRQTRDRGEVIVGTLEGRRTIAGRHEYGFRRYMRGSTPGLDLYTAKDGKLLLTESRSFPNKSEIDEKQNVLDEAAYDKWFETAGSAPKGFDETYHPKREWTTVAELIRGPTPNWREGSPPEDPEEVRELRAMTSKVSLDELRSWLKP